MRRRWAAIVLVLVCVGWSHAAGRKKAAKPRPSPPVELTTYDVLVRGSVVWAARTDGLAALDLTDPLHPVSVARLSMLGASLALTAAGDHVAVANGSRGLAIVDTSEAREPRTVAVWDGTGPVVDIELDGRYAYLAQGVEGLQVLDLRDPTRPMIATRVSSRGRVRRLALAGTELATAELAGGVRIFDVANPTAPRELGALDLDGAADVAWVGATLLVALGSDGLAIVDGAERHAVLHPSLGPAFELAVEGDLAVISGGSAGVRLVDLANPAEPRALGALRLPAGLGAGRAAIAGDRIYVAAAGGGIATIDIVDRMEPHALAPAGKRMRIVWP